MKIKVCGLRDEANIKAVEALKPDYMGFIFYPNSPRYVNGLIGGILKELQPDILKTGVFVNDSFDHINALLTEFCLDAVQLHGVENPEYCSGLKRRAQVIKAFNIDQDFKFTDLEPYLSHVNYFLFDTKSTKPGGSGLTFDWTILNNYIYNVPFFLSGGLSPDNISVALQIDNPQFYGVDLNSKFEISPGMKDIDKLKEVFNLIRTTA